MLFIGFRALSFACKIEIPGTGIISKPMTSYLVLASLLLVFAIIALRSQSPLLALCSTLLVGGFIALRYQLGYDWIAYERLFEEVPTFWERADTLPYYY